MVGLKDSKVIESDTTPLAMHKVVISVGKPSREELDWAICDIWPEINEPSPYPSSSQARRLTSPCPC